MANYVKADNKTYCSSACFETTLPKCEICKDPIRSGYNFGRHKYCDECARNKPTCFSCGLPAAYPTRIEDGRMICNGCMRWAVKTEDAAQQHYELALRHLQAWTSLTIATVPKLQLVDRNEMQKLSKKIRTSDSPISIRGLYSRQTQLHKRKLFGRWITEKEDTEETIYIVDHLHDEVFRVAAVHELMHDLIHEHFPRLENAPLWVHEGICQQAAAEYCRRRNYADTLKGIEDCTDTEYGGGYRYINALTGFEGWRALRRWMEEVDPSSLPKYAPR